MCHKNASNVANAVNDLDFKIDMIDYITNKFVTYITT